MLNKISPWFHTNLLLLQLREPFSYDVLSKTTSSDIQLPGTPTIELTSNSESRWLFQIGLGRQPAPPLDTHQQIWVIEPDPELTWCWWQEVDYHEWMIHPAVSYVCLNTADVLAWLNTQLSILPQLLGVTIQIEPSYQAILAQRQPDTLNGLLDIQTHVTQKQDFDSQTLLHKTKSLYQELDPIGEQVLNHYPTLSCRNGCADCCQSGCGWNLLLDPGEWLVMWEWIQAWPFEQKAGFYKEIVTLLQKHHHLLQPVWEWSMREPTQLRQHDRMRELIPLLDAVIHDPCPLLDTQQRCQIYEGRPLVCRLFGQSYWSQSKPYTCHRDWETHLQILAQEGEPNHLTQARSWYHHLKNIHEHHHFHQILLFWLLAQMDLEQHQWVTEPILDWRAFEQLPEKISVIKKLSLL